MSAQIEEYFDILDAPTLDLEGPVARKKRLLGTTEDMLLCEDGKTLSFTAIELINLIVNATPKHYNLDDQIRQTCHEMIAWGDGAYVIARAKMILMGEELEPTASLKGDDLVTDELRQEHVEALIARVKRQPVSGTEIEDEPEELTFIGLNPWLAEHDATVKAGDTLTLSSLLD